MSERKLATVRTVSEVLPIEGADFLCIYKIDGWQVIDQIGKYKTGDKVIYCEVDSWIPHELAPFLSKGKEPRKYKGIEGEKLRSIRLRGVISQGLLIPCSYSTVSNGYIGDVSASDDGADVTSLLGVQLWERELSPQLAGLAKGNFPSFIRKTDQQRVQNIGKLYEKFQEHSMEVTEKLEGQSLTVFFHQENFGVCSRNLELKEQEDNTLWKAANRYNMRENMTTLGLNIAIQGELVGAGIQGNIYGISDFDFYVYDVFDIDRQQYYNAEDRYSLVETLGLKHVPVLGYNWHSANTTEQLLAMSDGKSLLNPKQAREGVVLKAVDGSFSFKVISNLYSLNQE
jgi:RNA ligase (TIGR02306 family)